MQHAHPLKNSSNPLQGRYPATNIFDIGARLASQISDDEIEVSIQVLETISKEIERMQAELASKDDRIARYEDEIRELLMHKEAAYSEMSRAEMQARSEKDRADKAVAECLELSENEKKAQDQIKKLLFAVKSAFKVKEAIAA